MTTIAVVGLGYVGLPLAVEFGKKFRTIGFDLSVEKIESYKRFIDPTGEVSSEDLKAATMLEVGTNPAALKEADFVIVAVPTPVDDAHQPDFSPLVGSSKAVGQNLKQGAIVVFESTVYPGATEEVCIPIIERESGKTWKKDFFVGYSPERINPGDKERTVTKIVKVVSGDTPETLATVKEIYGSIITAGVYPASNIKVAEAAKVIENTQRDLNIALMNELAIIFDCIGVDPYYLTHKAQKLGYHPEVILAGRRINDGMGKFIAEKTIKQLIRRGHPVKDCPIIVLGLTFKEDCPDLRNSRVIDVIRELESYGAKVIVHDPVADVKEAHHEYGVDLVTWENLPKAAAIVAAVNHREFKIRPAGDFLSKLHQDGVITDVKSMFDAAAFAGSGIDIWRL